MKIPVPTLEDNFAEQDHSEHALYLSSTMLEISVLELYNLQI